MNAANQYHWQHLYLIFNLNPLQLGNFNNCGTFISLGDFSSSRCEISLSLGCCGMFMTSSQPRASKLGYKLDTGQRTVGDSSETSKRWVRDSLVTVWRQVRYKLEIVEKQVLDRLKVGQRQANDKLETGQIQVRDSLETSWRQIIDKLNTS